MRRAPTRLRRQYRVFEPQKTRTNSRVRIRWRSPTHQARPRYAPKAAARHKRLAGASNRQARFAIRAAGRPGWKVSLSRRSTQRRKQQKQRQAQRGPPRRKRRQQEQRQVPQRAPAQLELAEQNLATAAELEEQPYVGRGDARAGREIPLPYRPWQRPAKQVGLPTAFAQVAAWGAGTGWLERATPAQRAGLL